MNFMRGDIFFLSSWLILIWVYDIFELLTARQTHTHTHIDTFISVFFVPSLDSSFSPYSCRVSAGHEITIVLQQTTNRNADADVDDDATRVFDLDLGSSETLSLPLRKSKENARGVRCVCEN